MSVIPGLRSPYDKVGRLVFFGRMLDKIRLHQAGKLPPEYVANLGESRAGLFDARCCRFLGIGYEALRARVLEGGTDAEILAWAEATGTPRSDEDCMIWNQFMAKLGWRDDRTALVQRRIAESGLADRGIESMFDFLDCDEGRDLAVTRPWENL